MNALTRVLVLFSWFFVLSFSSIANAMEKGIYISQTTLENSELISYLIKNAKATGINTFIVDLDVPSKRYEKNISLLKNNNISYVARIVIFPGGGTAEQVASEEYREKKYRLVEAALKYGANRIQLDYIRYNTKQPPSHKNAENVTNVMRWFKDRLAVKNIPLEVDVFGISSYGESLYIGQNLKLISQVADAICPMVYPSHFTPFAEHFARPYKTVYNALDAIKDQFPGKPPMKIIPYIELSNYHYPLSHNKKLGYIYAQIHAAEDVGADGWYAWSANNKYDNLFKVLKSYPVK